MNDREELLSLVLDMLQRANYREVSENYGADAPPWRGRHGARWLSLNHEFGNTRLAPGQ